MDALKAVNYQHAKSIRMWKTGCEDEGVRAICEFIKVCPSVVILELLDNAITKLGCEFISRTLVPEAKSSIQVLKLDHNDFGSEGVKALAEGLSQNKVITSISLTYCNIDETAARSIFEILIYQQSVLEEMNLGGNHLKNAGTIEVLRGVSCAKSLKKIYLSDNQFSEEDIVLDAIEKCMKKNQNLGRYDFRYNFISDYGVSRIIEILEVANHVFEVEIPERISTTTLTAFKERIG